MDRHHIAGVTVSVVQNGQVVLEKGYGFAAPGRAVDPNTTLFRVGSISKTFTWIALMKEVEAGRMRLDAADQPLSARAAAGEGPGLQTPDLCPRPDGPFGRIRRPGAGPAVRGRTASACVR